MKKIALGLLLTATTPLFAANTAEFLYQKEPINPACVAMFNSSAVDFPYITAINPNECQHSNAAFQTSLQTEDGWHYFYKNDKDASGGEYRYKLIGKSANGIYVLNTLSSSGGSLNSAQLLLIKLEPSSQIVYNQDKLQRQSITEMKLVGYVNGGDRCIGGFADVKLTDNALQIQQHQGKNPVDCEKIKTFTIDLGKL